MARLTALAVPDPADRLDFEQLDHPLAGLELGSDDELQRHLRAYIDGDADRRNDPRHSADLGAFLALLSLFRQLPRVLASGRLTARSVAEEIDQWFFGYFNFLASGPPGFRLRQLVALSEAGVVRFLGAGIRVEREEATGTWLASGATVPGHTVRATALIEAYLPKHALARTRDPLLRDLHRAGRIVEEVIADPEHTHRSGLLTIRPADSRVLDPALDGEPHPRRTALGPHTSMRADAAFARPRTNSPGFRQNDAAARALLSALAGVPAALAGSR